MPWAPKTSARPKSRNPGVRASRNDRGYKVRHRKGRGSPGVDCHIDHIGDGGKIVVPPEHKIGKFLNETGVECSGSARQQSRGQKQLASRARIITGCRQQNRIADCGFFLVAAAHPRGDSGRFKGQSVAPAAEPPRVGADQIVERFQDDAGGEGGVDVAEIAAARQRPSRQAG